MSIYSAFKDHLLDTAALTAICGTRIYANAAPRGAALPYVVFARTDHSRSNPRESIVRVEMQIDCWATTPDTAISMGDAIWNNLHNYKGLMGDENLDVRWASEQGRSDDAFEPDFEEDVWTHLSSLDFAIWHAETIPTF